MNRIKQTFKEVLTATIPMIVIILILHFTVARFSTEMMISFLAGSVMMMIGLGMFLIGADVSMLRVGSLCGNFLVKKGKLAYTIAFGFVIGTVITVAEPSVQVLAQQVYTASSGLTNNLVLILLVGIGVGIFLVVALLRIIFQVQLYKILLVGYAIVFTLALFTSDSFLAVSFDAGGVTTGPITVPFILSLGAGITSSIRTKSGSDDSFGMVALASIGPIIAVLLLGVFFR